MKKEFSRVLLKNQSDEILILKDRPDTLGISLAENKNLVNQRWNVRFVK